jgi:hypothetical protein
MPGALLLQVPPVTASVRIVVEAWHTVKLPVIAAGNGFTVKIAVVVQPVGKVYVILVVPASIPDTTPPASIVATVVILLAHVPPAVASVSVVVRPWQTLSVPVMIEGSEFTVTIAVEMQPVPSV